MPDSGTGRGAEGVEGDAVKMLCTPPLKCAVIDPLDSRWREKGVCRLDETK